MVTLAEILQKLRSEDENQRAEGLAFMIKTGDPRALVYIDQIAQADPSPKLREIAKKGINYINSRREGSRSIPDSTEKVGARYPADSEESGIRPTSDPSDFSDTIHLKDKTNGPTIPSNFTVQSEENSESISPASEVNIMPKLVTDMEALSDGIVLEIAEDDPSKKVPSKPKDDEPKLITANLEEKDVFEQLANLSVFKDSDEKSAMDTGKKGADNLDDDSREEDMFKKLSSLIY